MWFGEQVPLIPIAVQKVETANIIIIIGTSMQVYPAAGLVHYAACDAKVYYIDPKPTINHELDLNKNLVIIPEKAGHGVPILVQKLLNEAH